MAKVTWLGEDTEDYAGPSYNTWNGIRFPKDKAVEVTDPNMIARAKNNRFYKVTEEKEHGDPKAETTGQDQGEGNAQAAQSPGYSPVKKKVRRPKAKAAAAHEHADS